MHELYLWPFAEGVRSGVGSVMIGYNAVSCPSMGFGIINTFRSMVLHVRRTAI